MCIHTSVESTAETDRCTDRQIEEPHMAQVEMASPSIDSVFLTTVEEVIADNARINADIDNFIEEGITACELVNAEETVVTPELAAAATAIATLACERGGDSFVLALRERARLQIRLRELRQLATTDASATARAAGLLQQYCERQQQRYNREQQHYEHQQQPRYNQRYNQRASPWPRFSP